MKTKSLLQLTEEILTEVEAGRVPEPAVIKRCRKALTDRKKSMTNLAKRAGKAAAAAGASGRPPKFDRHAIKASIRKNPERPVQETATEFGCSVNLVSKLRREVREG